jgi:hypothetical protein
MERYVFRFFARSVSGQADRNAGRVASKRSG